MSTPHKQHQVNVMTRRLQQMTSDDAIEPFRVAYREVMWGGQTDKPAVYIRLPFPFTSDDKWWCEKIHGLWKSFGYALRPGGPAGWAQDIIRLDKE
jgi:UDP-galactopyranose mutase